VFDECWGQPSAIPVAQASALKRYRWKNRVLVLQVRNLNQLALSRQKAIAPGRPGGLADQGYGCVCDDR
jgi:hypothetical protein